MAQCVAVYHEDKHFFEERQLVLEVEDGLKMVVQFDEPCEQCSQITDSHMEDLERFVQKFHALTSDEIAVELLLSSKQLFNRVAVLVPCIGCRRSVEQLYQQITLSQHPALEPLLITADSYLSIKRDVLFDPKAVFALFHIHGPKLTEVLQAANRTRKNKRCLLHCRDSHKAKLLGSWIDVWSVMSTECREELLLVERDSLMETLETYLSKHRFCGECKSKVLQAYKLLIGEMDGKSGDGSGYQPSLYDGLRCCAGEQHIHIACDTQFIARLMARAETDVLGSSRERHAKTIDIAQEEVLTCLGIFVYERLQRVWLKLRAEEQAWQLLFYCAINTLKTAFEVSVEKKTGAGDIHLLCQQFEDKTTPVKENKKVSKEKGKSKKNKNKKKNNSGSAAPPQDPPVCSTCGSFDQENCQCDENINSAEIQCASCDKNHAAPDHHHNQQQGGKKRRKKKSANQNPAVNSPKHNNGTPKRHGNQNSSSAPSTPSKNNDDTCQCDTRQPLRNKNDGGDSGFTGDCIGGGDNPYIESVSAAECVLDCGYLSCETCGSHDSSSEHSTSAESINHPSDVGTSGDSACGDSGVWNPSPKFNLRNNWVCSRTLRTNGLSLEDMLEESSNMQEETISIEDINYYKQNEESVKSERLLLREKLRERFNNICGNLLNQ